MHTSLNKILTNCKTLMLDMDGTILDLAYDSSIWLDLVPKEYAQKKGISLKEANAELHKYFVCCRVLVRVIDFLIVAPHLFPNLLLSFIVYSPLQKLLLYYNIVYI